MKGQIGDSQQVAPAQTHLAHKVEGTSPPDSINSELLSTYTASVDTETSNCVLNSVSFLQVLLAPQSHVLEQDRLCQIRMPTTISPNLTIR
jgi:hypothetical protein